MIETIEDITDDYITSDDELCILPNGKTIVLNSENIKGYTFTSSLNNKIINKNNVV